jgi:hypothetical protein
MYDEDPTPLRASGIPVCDTQRFLHEGTLKKRTE